MKQKLASVMTPAELLAKCLASNRSPFCAGHAMAIVDLLREWHWSITALASISKVQRQTFSAIIGLEQFPRSDRLERVAQAFHIELHELNLPA